MFRCVYYFLVLLLFLLLLLRTCSILTRSTIEFTRRKCQEIYNYLKENSITVDCTVPAALRPRFFYQPDKLLWTKSFTVDGCRQVLFCGLFGWSFPYLRKKQALLPFVGILPFCCAVLLSMFSHFCCNSVSLA